MTRRRQGKLSRRWRRCRARRNKQGSCRGYTRYTLLLIILFFSSSSSLYKWEEFERPGQVRESPGLKLLRATLFLVRWDATEGEMVQVQIQKGQPVQL
eukprot:g62125.t1